MTRRIPDDMLEDTIHETNNFGELKIVKYITAKNVLVQFLNTGYTKTTSSVNIRQGCIKDPYVPNVCAKGFLGEGCYVAKVQGKHTKGYSVWSSMLKRCYSEAYHKVGHTYKGCTVCTEWLDFQLFSKWFDANYIDGLVLDKDTKVGTKGTLYSPDTCCFITHKENSIEANARRDY